ncbi:MAG: hypothetical protein MHPSP_004117, partial [Paramarteilia canceri]
LIYTVLKDSKLYNKSNSLKSLDLVTKSELKKFIDQGFFFDSLKNSLLEIYDFRFVEDVLNEINDYIVQNIKEFSELLKDHGKLREKKISTKTKIEPFDFNYSARVRINVDLEENPNRKDEIK